MIFLFFSVTTDSLGSHFLSAADTVTKIEIDDDNIGEMTIMNPTSGGASTSKAIKKGMKSENIDLYKKNWNHEKFLQEATFQKEKRKSVCGLRAMAPLVEKHLQNLTASKDI